jgi:beta-lactamase regulating signal transducer with metallopeptidase domain
MTAAVLAYIANGLWQIPLAAAAAWILTRVGVFSPAARCRVWSLALTAAAILPALPAVRLPSLPPPVPVAAAPLASAAVLGAAPAPQPPPAFALDPGIAHLIVWAFVAMVAFGVVRLALSLLAAGRLARTSRPLNLAAAVAATLDDYAVAHGRGRPPVRESAGLAGPAVVGARAPLILVPPGFAGLDEDDQRAALLHELAHVLRRDYAGNLFAQVAGAPIAWHPAAWALVAGLRASREAACDALAAAALSPGHAYARRLVRLARAFAPSHSPALVGLIGRSSLETRLMHLLTPAPRPSRARRLAAALLAGAVLSPVLLLRVSPAVAEPVAPAAPIAPAAALVAPSTPAPPAAPVVRVRNEHLRRFAHLDQLPAGDPPPPPPPPDAPMPPEPPVPPAPPIPPEPPAPPPPPGAFAPNIDAAAIQRTVEQALRASAAARESLMHGEMQKVMAEMRAHQGQMSAQAREKLRREVRQDVEAWKAQHLPEIMAEVRRSMDSDAFRQAMRDSARAASEGARAAAEAARVTEAAEAASERPPEH